MILVRSSQGIGFASSFSELDYDHRGIAHLALDADLGELFAIGKDKGYAGHGFLMDFPDGAI
jgi:hypothetical protein